MTSASPIPHAAYSSPYSSSPISIKSHYTITPSIQLLLPSAIYPRAACDLARYMRWRSSLLPMRSVGGLTRPASGFPGIGTAALEEEPLAADSTTPTLTLATPGDYHAVACRVPRQKAGKAPHGVANPARCRASAAQLPHPALGVRRSSRLSYCLHVYLFVC